VDSGQKAPGSCSCAHGTPTPLSAAAPYDKLFYGPGPQRSPEVSTCRPSATSPTSPTSTCRGMPPGIEDANHPIAMYDGALAYIDACIPGSSSTDSTSSGELDNTIIVYNPTSGETLYDHGCYFDHHGLV